MPPHSRPRRGGRHDPAERIRQAPKRAILRVTGGRSAALWARQVRREWSVRGCAAHFGNAPLMPIERAWAAVFSNVRRPLRRCATCATPSASRRRATRAPARTRHARRRPRRARARRVRRGWAADAFDDIALVGRLLGPFSEEVHGGVGLLVSLIPYWIFVLYVFGQYRQPGSSIGGSSAVASLDGASALTVGSWLLLVALVIARGDEAPVTMLVAFWGLARRLRAAPPLARAVRGVAPSPPSPSAP